MSWREAARLSDVAFTELSLQAIFALRQGNVLPPGPARALVPRARRRVLQSKLVIGGVLALFALGGAYALNSAPLLHSSLAQGISSGEFRAGLLTGLFSLDVAFLWWTGMQVLPTFLAAGVFPLLETLPIDERTVARTASLLYLRLFDLPALTILVVTPLFVGLELGPLAGLAVVPGAVATVAFALALSLLTGRFFVRRVQGSRGGGGNTVVRWGYLVLWLLPAFAMFGFVIAAPGYFSLLRSIAETGSSTAGDLLFGTFPFPFAVLAAIAASGPDGMGLAAGGLDVLVVALGGYLALAAVAIYWVFASVRRIGLVPATGVRPLMPRAVALHSVRPAYAVLVKDLRIASRTPGYAFLILLPILDALALGLWTYASAPSATAANSLGLAAVTTSALLATFFGPAFFAIEVFAHSYARTLPLSGRSLLGGKVALVAGMYLVASAVVAGLTLPRVFDPTLFLGFIAAELPAVLAASLLELGILLRRAEARGLPITNLYAGAWIAFLVAIPGLLVASLPLVAFQLAGAWTPDLALSLMGLVAVAELALAAPFAAGRERS